MSAPIRNTDEYLNGMKDCRDGIQADPKRCGDYQRGYGTQYQHEQNLNNTSDMIARGRR